MKINIDKQLILESVQKQNEPFYIYHIGVKGYKEILPGGLVRSKKESEDFRTKHKLSKEYMDTYNFEINAFLGEVKKEHIQMLRNKNFINWVGRDLYLYKININDPENRKKIKYIKYTSTPEQTKLQEKVYWPILEKYRDASDDVWEEKMKPYFEAEKKFKYTKKKMTFNQGINIDKKILNDMKDLNKWFKFNSIHGNKKQYATYIPHVQLYSKQGLKFESMEKII